MRQNTAKLRKRHSDRKNMKDNWKLFKSHWIKKKGLNLISIIENTVV